MWEVPGGTCETSDPTIFHTLSREVFEETGLLVSAIKEQVGDLECSSLKGVRWAKMCFIVSVMDTRDQQIGAEEQLNEKKGSSLSISIDPEEHEAWRLADREVVEEVCVMSEGQREVMRAGFNIAQL